MGIRKLVRGERKKNEVKEIKGKRKQINYKRIFK